jgi:hypothetical protein
MMLNWMHAVQVNDVDTDTDIDMRLYGDCCSIFVWMAVMQRQMQHTMSMQ